MKSRLWNLSPAERFDQCFPIGNGRLGAMIAGHPLRREDYFSERISLNEETVWYGGPSFRGNPDSLKTLPRVRELLLEGRISEAEYLADAGMAATPRNGRPYQALGEMVFTGREEYCPVDNYIRELNLERAIAHVSYRSGGTRHEREYFVSAPANVLAVRLSCSGLEKLNFHVYLRRRPFDGSVFFEGGDIVGIKGQAGPDGIRFAAAMAARVEGGFAVLDGQCLRIDEADAVTFFVAAATDFREKNSREECVGRLRNALSREYAELREAHVRDYRRLYKRVSIDLGAGPNLPTDLRLERLRQGERDPALYALHFQFARYLTISASRPGSLPMNLQGIWCEGMTPVWNCNYTINVNLEMEYWPAEGANLAECHEPLFDFLKRLVESGRRTALEMYGCRGFVAHHTIDMWADTAPTGGVYASGLWPFGGAWLALHAWEHFLFGGDIGFLRTTAYPIIKEAALFFCDYLMTDKEGRRVALPSVSPENWYLLPGGRKTKMCAGAAMDGQILHELFGACAAAAELLGVDEALRDEWLRLREELPRPTIGRSGAIQEWLSDYEENDPSHRHVSHLFALHPGTQISPLEDARLARAAGETLKRRLSHATDRTGWSQAWMANHHARLLDGESALGCLRRVLTLFTHDSLLGDCPPMNLDSNFGACSAMLEMLMQSHRGEIHLLPALPEEWADGEVGGLRARGGFVVGITWKSGRLAWAKIEAQSEGFCRIRVNEPLHSVPGLSSERRDDGYYIYRVTLGKGQSITIKRKALALPLDCSGLNTAHQGLLQ